MPGVGAGPRVPLDGEDGARRAHRVGQGDGEEAGAGVEVSHRRPRQSPARSSTAASRAAAAPAWTCQKTPRGDAVGAPGDDGVHGAGRPADLSPDDEAGADVGERGSAGPGA